MKEIICSNGKAAKVDDADFPLLSKFNWIGWDYPQTHVSRRGDGRIIQHTISMHTFILRGQSGMLLDHINGDTYDNRRENLRLVTPTQNLRNMRKKKVGPFNPYKGVSPANFIRYGTAPGVRGRKRGKAWRALIKIGNKQLCVGRFDTPEEAARCYDAAALKHFGPHACLNFPQEHQKAA